MGKDTGQDEDNRDGTAKILWSSAYDVVYLWFQYMGGGPRSSRVDIPDSGMKLEASMQYMTFSIKDKTNRKKKEFRVSAIYGGLYLNFQIQNAKAERP